MSHHAHWCGPLQSRECQESISPIPSARRSVRTATLPRASFRAIWRRVISTRCDGRSPRTPGSGSPRPSISAAAPPAACPRTRSAAFSTLIPGRPWLEATLEAAPGSITAEKARAWVDAGINRVSLGVQSFVDAEIRRTGRKHSAAIVAEEIACSATPACADINIDLIAGLSGQTEASWRESLDWIERLAPEHVSVYMLEVDEDSRLGKEMLLGGVRYGARGHAIGRPDRGVLRDRRRAPRRARHPALRDLELRAPRPRSRHNLKYWTLEPYVGFGADAHSFDGRRWSEPGIARGVRSRPSSARDGPTPTSDDERFFLGLRLTRPASARPPTNGRRFAEPIRRFLDDGLLESHDGALRLTDRGVLLSNEVFQEFLTA